MIFSQVLRNFESYSFPADIWSFGAVVHYFVNCQHLFASAKEVLTWSKRDALPSCYSPELRALVASMLDPNPKGRPTAKEIFEETQRGNKQTQKK